MNIHFSMLIYFHVSFHLPLSDIPSLIIVISKSLKHEQINWIYLFRFAILSRRQVNIIMQIVIILKVTCSIIKRPLTIYDAGTHAKGGRRERERGGGGHPNRHMHPF